MSRIAAELPTAELAAARLATARLATGVDELIDSAVRQLRGRTIAVLTGAGVSTDSGIPDYRGEGAPARTPMTFQQFLTDTEYRKRYWAGSHLGWRRFTSVAPNAGHRALVDLERAGRVNGILTQNVDGLHRMAGSARVIELHGTMNRVRCLHCGQVFAREDIAKRMENANPWLDTPDDVELAPDGDVAVSQLDGFVIPVCTNCGGMLKPDVVFFGELIPSDRFAAASTVVRGANALVVAGSSLVVNSGIRLLDQAVKRRLPIVIINRGATRGDLRATVKLDAGTSETLTVLAARLSI